MRDFLHVAQLSDTHFLESGEAPEGGFAYDTQAAFDAIFSGTEETPGLRSETFDLVAVTGDIADHGRAEQYRVAARAFEQIGSPVNVCPGNHDQDLAFGVGMARPGIGTSRVIELGHWCFVFVDSNAGMMRVDGDGRRVDPDTYEQRLHANGALGSAETAWIQAVHDATLAEHVFVWVHHPPGPASALSEDADYAAEWERLIPALPKLRGIGGGHTHVPRQYEFAGIPVHVSPSLKNNFDLDAQTMLPPGYRSYAFAPDGSVTSEARLVDDPRWPRHPMSRLVVALFTGEVDWDEFNAIVARKSAQRE